MFGYAIFFRAPVSTPIKGKPLTSIINHWLSHLIFQNAQFQTFRTWWKAAVWGRFE
jgi:hypothetical protein